MKISLVFLLLAAFAAAKTTWQDLEEYSFEHYLKEFGKSYHGTEYSWRKKLFDSKLNSIRSHNADPTKSWKRGINHMSDWSHEEFKKLLGYQKSEKKAVSEYEFDQVDSGALPTHVDWRDKGVVTAVKDQGLCGSCWSFGSAEALESAFAIATGKLVDLSEQQILDCTPNPNDCGGSGGCGGGTYELAYSMIMKMGGLSSEWTYPYRSYFGSNYNCHFNASQTRPIVKISRFTSLPTNHYNPVMHAVATHGPLVISVDASAWSDYETGIFDGCNQTNPDLDHAVLLVGYGRDPEILEDYYLVRNSWSPLWGEKGYIRLRRTTSEQTRCGLDLTPSDGSACNNSTVPIAVCGTCGILYDCGFPSVAN